MTDITKAVAFAKECLGWTRPIHHGIRVIEDVDVPYRSFDPDSAFDITRQLKTFLGQRFFIQINRGTSSLFRWTVIVGLQNRIGGPSIFDHGRGESNDMLDAIFDACLAAARIFGTETIPQA